MTTFLTSNTQSQNQNDQQVGANPVNITWNVVRGDTSSILVSFLNKDQISSFDTSGWTYISKAYSSKNNQFYTLTTEIIDNSVKISASSAVTATWGTELKGRPEELSFDLQVTMNNGVVWTPIIGTIVTIKDVPTGVSL